MVSVFSGRRKQFLKTFLSASFSPKIIEKLLSLEDQGEKVGGIAVEPCTEISTGHFLLSFLLLKVQYSREGIILKSLKTS